MPGKRNKKSASSQEDVKAVPCDIFVFPNGEKYDGEYNQLEDGTIERNGLGQHTTASGMILKGEWKNDKLNGTGTVIHPCGACYEGEFLDNMMHGHGKYIFADQSVYEGPFNKNRLEGEGTYTDSSGQIWCGKFNFRSANGLEFKLNM